MMEAEKTKQKPKLKKFAVVSALGDGKGGKAKIEKITLVDPFGDGKGKARIEKNRGSGPLQKKHSKKTK